MSRGLARRLLALALVAVATACTTEPDGSGVDDRLVHTVEARLDQRIVVRSSVLRFDLSGAGSLGVTRAIIGFQGRTDEGRAVDVAYLVALGPQVDDGADLVVELPVVDGLWQALAPSPEARFEGRVTVALLDDLGVTGRASLPGIDLRLMERFAPSVDAIPWGPHHVGERIDVDGAGFLRPEEGSTWLVVDAGTLIYPDGATRRIADGRVALAWSGRRDRALLPISPSLFGVREGRFEGKVRLFNALKTGERFAGEAPGSMAFEIRGARIEGIDPGAASRGQKVRLTGRGLLPDDPGAGTGLYLLFEGELTPAVGGPTIDFRAERAIARVPSRVIDGRTLELEVWYEVDEEARRLSGLGAIPGVFRGSVTPVAFDATAEAAGPAFDLSFEVLPPRQIVYLKYLPGFADALSAYGLANVEAEIRRRVREVLVRDYEGVNVGFVEAPPEDFADYTTIEIGGPDPSGLGQFGYDNSFHDGGKDVGNLYLDDYLGGVNRRSEEAGYLPYGGVFIGSFRAFSPTVFPDAPGTSPAFDRVMAPFMAELGGTQVLGTEWPDGPRRAAIQAAIRMVGNLTGHTASHEIGHALGLSHVPPSVDGYAERFHNDPPGPRLIMDAGGERPFAERAEVDGAGPARFSPQNFDYLRAILPLSAR